MSVPLCIVKIVLTTFEVSDFDPVLLITIAASTDLGLLHNWNFTPTPKFIPTALRHMDSRQTNNPRTLYLPTLAVTNMETYKFFSNFSLIFTIKVHTICAAAILHFLNVFNYSRVVNIADKYLT